jgi:protein CMS1
MSDTKKRSSEPMSRPRKKRKPATASDESGFLDNEAGINLMFSRMDGQLLADLLAKNVTRFGKDLSPVEIADLSIAGRDYPNVLTNVPPTST